MILRGGIPDSGTAPAGGGRGLGADDVVASGRVPFVAIGKAASSNPWRRPAHRRCRVVAIRAVRAFLSNKYVVDLAARSLLRLRRF